MRPQYQSQAAGSKQWWENQSLVCVASKIGHQMHILYRKLIHGFCNEILSPLGQERALNSNNFWVLSNKFERAYIFYAPSPRSTCAIDHKWHQSQINLSFSQNLGKNFIVSLLHGLEIIHIGANWPPLRYYDALQLYNDLRTDNKQDIIDTSK